MTAPRVDFHAAARAQMSLLGEPEGQQKASEEQRRRRARLRDSGIAANMLEDDVQRVIANELKTLPSGVEAPIEKGELRVTKALSAVLRWDYVHRELGVKAYNTLVLIGPMGVGKTLAGAWLLAREIELEKHAGKPLGGPIYVMADDLRLAHASKDLLFARATQAGVLVVDELGTESDLDEARSMLLTLVNRRASLSASWTLLIANVTKEVFEKRYCDRAISKLLQRGFFATVDGDNLRVPLEQRPEYQQALERANAKVRTP